MNKISCDICTDLIPLVKDEVASEDSKKAVLEHINLCPACKALYGNEIAFSSSDPKIISKIKKHLLKLSLSIIVLAMLFGISLSANQFMFYNILIMPTIGAISYFSLKKKAVFSCLAIFVLVYLRWFFHSSGYLLEGNLLQAFLPPLWWAIIYLGLTVFGVVVAMLLRFGFGKEQKNEENS